MLTDYEIYQSPFTWRYGSPGMRRLWSEANKRRVWRQLWVALAEVQAEYGLVRPEQVQDLRSHVDEVDLPRALAIEAEIHHDLMAELNTYAEQAPTGGPILHLGATSMDIEDNADALRMRQALELVGEKLDALLGAFAEKIETYADTPLIAFTHLQPAEPSTLGYRLALYAQDLLIDRAALGRRRRDLKGKGFKDVNPLDKIFCMDIGKITPFSETTEFLSEEMIFQFFLLQEWFKIFPSEYRDFAFWETPHIDQVLDIVRK